ncbi:TRAP transporter permease [Dysosmobacter sp.]|uniref:TRAP transporter permease n=1 Tax=Dysosmobacter sp. TaxID=2591382 RepID=UPI002A88A95B|nr:TRAP transporter fused permease subunit [Dysosmobacter sp.]MDY3281042.1 TRAP transporter fused permease subunit [Dysosmobacter sp.]
METGTAADVEAMMKKYDRESNVRVWEGVPKTVIRWIMICFSLYSIWVTLFSNAMPQKRLTVFVGMIIVMGYLTFPRKKGTVKVNSLPWYDIVLMVMGAFPFFWYAANAVEIIKMSKKIDLFLVVLGCLALLSIFELCRRSVGIPILCVAGVLLVYAFTNIYGRNPDVFKMFRSVVYALFYSESGVMATPINVCAKYIVVFIIFGAFLERTGISGFFIDLANSLCGSTAGGPAKVAVVSSALCGMVSGSSVGNTVTTGSVTIPMMKRTGYKGEFAGAVEAASSTGGQIMPPIMGAAAFLMAEYMGITYAEVAMRAILPAVLYFTGIYIAVHLEARKLGLKGIPKEELPKFGNLIKKIYLLLPLVVLVYLVATNTRTMQSSAAIAIIVCILVGLVNKDDRITVNKILDALEAGGRSTISVAVACSMAGVIAGCITVTGLASKLLSGIMTASMGIPLIALFLTMLCCIVLGMGVPTTANYCIMASTCAPILIQMGFPVVSAHFFVFYFGIVADITPPVALAAYAGAAIAKSNAMKTALNATKLAIAAFIVPYIFAMNPAMLFVDTNAIQVIQICITSVMGIFGVAAALNGYLYKHINPLFRLLIAAGGLAMMIPGTLTDVVGLALVVVIIVLQRASAKRVAA